MVMQSIDQYGLNFQIKVISCLLNDREFLNNVMDIMSGDYFPSQSHKWIVDEIMKYFNKYHSTPSLDVLKIELQKLPNEILQISIKEQLKLSYTAEEEDVEYVKEEFTNFCKNQKLKTALLESVDLLQGGDFEGIRDKIDHALKAGQDKNIGLEYEQNIEERYKEDYRNPIPTPWPEINEITQGGLGEGDLGIIYGNPGGGKSWTLVQLGAYAASLGYNVLHYTLELGEGYVGRRYDAHFTKISVSEITNHKDKVSKVLEGLEGRIIIKEYPMKGANLHTLRAHIQKSTSNGFKPDLILIDYLDIMSGGGAYKDEKAELDYLYAGAKGLAKELHLPIWTASQVNRAGAKDDIIEGDKSAGSYNKIMIGDYVMSLSRKKEDKVNKTGRFHIMKNRYGADGMSYFISADTEIGEFEIIEEFDEDNETHTNQISKQEKQDIHNLGIDKSDKAQLRKAFFNFSNQAD